MTSQSLMAQFIAAGAVPFETSVLQPAEVLLDLYGEDIRARAYVTHDPLRGELMLRPDFTVPIVQAHMSHGAEPARYAYSGSVFRKQEDDQGRPSEYIQTGFELFARSDPSNADAEVFALFAKTLEGFNLRAAIGDIGLLMAAIDGLSTTAKRRAALRRHVWRPRRFRALLDRFSGRSAPRKSRQKLLAKLEQSGLEAMFDRAGPVIGLRSEAEIIARLNALQEDAQTPPIDAAEVALIDDLLAIRAAPQDALAHLSDLAVDMPAIEPAVTRLDARLQALVAKGVDLSRLEFEASFGRTSMEYYDGFVFGFFAENRPDLPAVATGGRYDALTRVLGGGRAIPAVGGVIRPELLAEVVP